MSTGRRRRRGGELLVTLVLFATVLSSCSGSDAAALAQKACGLVHRSIGVYDKAQSETGKEKEQDLSRALALLRRALAPATLASTSDGSFQALSATLSESNRVAEADLVPALTAQCSSS